MNEPILSVKNTLFCAGQVSDEEGVISAMAIQLLGAFLFALLIGVLFGKRYIPWLKKKGFVQPIKGQVTKIYSDNETDSSDDHKGADC